MNEEPRPDHGPASMDEKLVDHLLGETDAATAAEVEAALAADGALRARRAELEAALGLLRTPEIAPALARERRDALREAAARQADGAPAGGGPAAAPAGRLRRFPMLRAAAGLLVFGGIVALALQQYPRGDADLGTYAALDAKTEAAAGSGAPASSEPVTDRVAPMPLDGIGYAADTPPNDASGAAGLRLPEFETSLDLQEAVVGGRVDHGALDKSAVAALPQAELLGSQPVLRELGYVGGARPQDPAASLLSVTGGEAGTALDSRLGDLAPAATGGAATPSAPSTPSTPATPNVRPTTGGAPSRSMPAPGSENLRRDRGGAPGARALDLGLEARVDPVRGSKAGDYYWEIETLEVLADADDGEGPRCIVVDGYGRRYYDEAVFEHLRPHRGGHGHESPRDMFFRYSGDNPVVASADQALSTFAADVDTASYPLVRNYLLQGSLPPKDAVRTEEFVNYFPLGLQPPSEGDFAVYLDAAPSRYVQEPKLLLRAGIKAREVSREQRKPLNLVFVIDTSGSMASGNRMELVKRSLELLVDQLRDDDTVGIVRFESQAYQVLAPTTGAQRWEIREAVRGLTTGGSTNAGAGLDLGYAMAERAFREGAVNRVVLASDGVANTGETDQERILAAVRARAEAHIDLTTIGVGMGNHNDVFLEQLADKGDGSCHYVDDFDEAKRVLVDGFTGTMQTIARDVKIQLEFDGEIVQGWRQLGYENRALTAEQFRDDAVDAGEVGAGHQVAALYELDLQPGVSGDAKLVTLRLRWFPDGADQAVEEEHTLSLAEARTKWALAEPAFRLSAVAAQFAEVLRRSWHARADSYAALREDSEQLARELPDARVAELRDLIARTESLARRGPSDDPLVQLIEEARRTRLLEAQLAARDQDARVSEMLEQVRLQNERIEAQLKELLEKP